MGKILEHNVTIWVNKLTIMDILYIGIEESNDFLGHYTSKKS